MTEEVSVIVKAIDKITAPLKKVMGTMKKFTAVTDKVTETTQKYSDTGASVMKKRIDELTGTTRTITTETTKLTAKGKEFNELTIKQIDGQKRFRMELLGVMFLGQGVKQMFMGLLRPGLQTVGFFQILSNTLAVLFIPIALFLLKIFLPIFMWLMKLPEGVKLVIGAFTILGAIIGGALAFFGSLVLGVQALGMAFAPLGTAITVAGGVIPWLIGIIGSLAVPIGIIIASIALFALAWKTNFANIRKHTKDFVDGIKNIIGGIIDEIKGFFNIFIGIITGDRDKIEKGINLIMSGTKRIFKDGFLKVIETIGNFTIDAAIALFEGGKKLVRNLIKGIGYLAVEVGEALWGLIPEPFKKLVGGITGGIVGGVKSMMGFGDFVWRPGSPPIRISPSDTLVGAKSGGGGGNVYNFSPTYNISATVGSDIDKEELINDLNSRLEDTVRTLIR